MSTAPIARISTGTIMLDDFLTRAILAGLGLVLATGALGCFVVWRRMAYFGDSTAHAAILGVALSLVFSLPIYLGTLGIALTMALAVTWLTARGQQMDTVLGVLAHSALALGLVAASFVPSMRTGLDASHPGRWSRVRSSSLSSREPSSAYMICMSAGRPASARTSQSRHILASSTAPARASAVTASAASRSQQNR